MVVIDLSLNGKPLASAGDENISVISADISACGILGKKSLGTELIKEGYQITLSLGGSSFNIIWDNMIRFDWARELELCVGDQIDIRFREGDIADQPINPLPQINIDEFEKLKRESWEKAREFYFKHKEKYESL